MRQSEGSEKVAVTFVRGERCGLSDKSVVKRAANSARNSLHALDAPVQKLELILTDRERDDISCTLYKGFQKRVIYPAALVIRSLTAAHFGLQTNGLRRESGPSVEESPLVRIRLGIGPASAQVTEPSKQ